MKTRVMIVDDEDTIRKLLKSRLEREGHEVAVVTSADEAMAAFGSGTPTSVLVTDLRMPGKDGFELMAWVRRQHPETSVIVITGHGEKDVAVKALRSGACDYLEKPFDMDEFSHSVGRAIREYDLRKENHELLDCLQARVERVEGKTEDRYWYVSKAIAMSKVNDWLAVLRREAMRGGAEEPTVLVTGESGTGKEGIARMIHAGSRRARGPWVAVNCANFNEQLLESELFGHERGAFTGAVSMKRGIFELAKGGTLFLDEIGEMDIKLQAKLLRVLQEKTFRRVGGTVDLTADVRIVAATNANLEARVRQGAFRDDLYHRLDRVTLHLPPLHERSEDIVPMTEQFFEHALRARGKKYEGLTPAAQDALRAYSWPGNVRELLNVVERAALLWEGQGPLTPSVLTIPTSTPAAIGQPKLSLVKSPADALNGTTGEESYTDLKKKWAESFEREYLLSMLAKHTGNVSAAAREAKLDRSNFLRLLRRYNLRAESYRKAA